MTSDLPDGSVPHAIVGDVDRPELDEATAHHLRRVRRLRTGDPITVTDGAGRWRRASLGSADRDLHVDGDIVAVAPAPHVTVAFALTKGTKPDLVVQKLTELGVDRIVPFVAERSVVRWTPDKAAAQHRRWTSIARGAVEQSRRVWIPEVGPLVDFADVIGDLGAALADRDGDTLDDTDSVVAIGPEGGWSDSERARAPRRVRIAENVLRAETAAIAVAALMTNSRRRP